MRRWSSRDWQSEYCSEISENSAKKLCLFCSSSREKMKISSSFERVFSLINWENCLKWWGKYSRSNRDLRAEILGKICLDEMLKWRLFLIDFWTFELFLMRIRSMKWETRFRDRKMIVQCEFHGNFQVA